MFDRFTDKAIKIIQVAMEESRRQGHNYVGTGQILIGLCFVPCLSSKVLKESGLDLQTARKALEEKEGKGSGPVNVEIPFNDEAKRALELAWHEAELREDDHISSEHLLLGLLAMGSDSACDIVSEKCGSCVNLKAELKKQMT